MWWMSIDVVFVFFGVFFFFFIDYTLVWWRYWVVLSYCLFYVKELTCAQKSDC